MRAAFDRRRRTIVELLLGDPGGAVPDAARARSTPTRRSTELIGKELRGVAHRRHRRAGRRDPGARRGGGGSGRGVRHARLLPAVLRPGRRRPAHRRRRGWARCSPRRSRRSTPSECGGLERTPLRSSARRVRAAQAGRRTRAVGAGQHGLPVHRGRDRDAWRCGPASTPPASSTALTVPETSSVGALVVVGHDDGPGEPGRVARPRPPGSPDPVGDEPAGERHGQHAVGDHVGQAHADGEPLVPVDRVEVAGRAGVADQVRARHAAATAPGARRPDRRRSVMPTRSADSAGDER